MTDEDGEYVAEPDGLDELDVFGSSGGAGADARQAGDGSVDGLDKITAQMPVGEHRPEQQEMCRAVAEAPSPEWDRRLVLPFALEVAAA